MLPSLVNKDPKGLPDYFNTKPPHQTTAQRNQIIGHGIKSASGCILDLIPPIENANIRIKDSLCCIQELMPGIESAMEYILIPLPAVESAMG